MAVPLTVVAGYLGSGKTTAISELLTSATSHDVAVVVNDFGELEFDAALLGGAAGDPVSFANGCVCCEARDGLGPALERMLARRPSRVVLEASGVADAASLAGWATTPGYVPGGVIVCADVTTLRRRLRDRWVGDTVRRQLAAADVVLLTHTDLADAALIDGMRFLVGEHAPRTQVVLRTPGAGLAAALAAIDQTEGVGTPIAPGPHAHHETWTLVTDRPVPRGALTAALRAVPDGVVRVKGFVRLEGDDRVHAVQCVGRRAVVAPAPDAALPALVPPAGGALTVIAREGTPPHLPSLAVLGLAIAQPTCAVG